MDTWLLLRNIEYNGERNRTLVVLKSRGMDHSNQVREFIMTKKGIDLIDVYAGSDQVLTGSARIAQQNRERAAAEVSKLASERRSREIAQDLRLIEARIEALNAEALAASQEAEFINIEENIKLEHTARNTRAMSELRDLSKRGL